MKKTTLLIVLILTAVLLLSACQVNTATPAPVQETEASAAAPTEEAEATEPVVPTVEVPPTTVPVEELKLMDEQGKMICQVYPAMFSTELTPQEAEAVKNIPAISAEDWQKGPDDAVLTILEYSDFQCPACAMFYTEVEKLMEQRPDEVKLVFRNFPLVGIHPNATLAAQAAEAAGLQGDEAYWAMYKELFSKQNDWSQKTDAEFTTWLEEAAETLGLDLDKFKQDLKSPEMVKKLQDQINHGTEIGISATPTIILNGRPWPYQWDAATLGMVMDVIKSEEKLHTECPDFVIDQNKSYTATLKMEKGDVVIDLFPKEAPLAVNSFVTLAREGFYDGVTFHRVLKDFVAQGGDPSGTGMGGAGYEYREEVSPNLKFDSEGVVGIAKGPQPGTSGSQFFITYSAQPNLDGGYTIIGKVSSGMDVVKAITERDPQMMPEAEGDKIISITIDEK